MGSASAGTDQEDNCSLSCDISLRAPVLEHFHLSNALEQVGALGALSSVSGESQSTIKETRAQYTWNKPLSALANLPLQLNPSIMYAMPNELNKTKEVSYSIMCGTEEEGKARLCKSLKDAITAEGGVLPPAKKRGLGAEVLACTQALLQTPLSTTATSPSEPVTEQNKEEFQNYADYRNNTKTGLGFNFAVATRSHGLLSVSLAVIEAMQRSSGKQFQALCDWQCSFYVRTAREAELDEIAHKFQDFDVCMAHIMSYFLPNNKAVTITDKVVSGDSSSLKSKEKEKDALATSGPVDLVHILVQLVR